MLAFCLIQPKVAPSAPGGKFHCIFRPFHLKLSTFFIKISNRGTSALIFSTLTEPSKRVSRTVRECFHHKRFYMPKRKALRNMSTRKRRQVLRVRYPKISCRRNSFVLSRSAEPKRRRGKARVWLFDCTSVRRRNAKVKYETKTE